MNERSDREAHELSLRRAAAFPYQEDDNYGASEGISTHLYVATHLLAGLLSYEPSPSVDEVKQAIELAKILIADCD